MMRKTLVIGASEQAERYSNKAILSLLEHHHPVVAMANRSGKVGAINFLTTKEIVADVDTVTLYINPEVQKEYIDYIVSLHPKRVIFNPGTENPAFFERLKKQGIEATEACTLVLLNTDQYE